MLKYFPSEKVSPKILHLDGNHLIGNRSLDDDPFL